MRAVPKQFPKLFQCGVVLVSRKTFRVVLKFKVKNPCLEQAGSLDIETSIYELPGKSSIVHLFCFMKDRSAIWKEDEKTAYTARS